MSYGLPAAPFEALRLLICRLEDVLEASAHTVGAAMAEHSSFDERYVESPLCRSLISDGVRKVAGDEIEVITLSNGGLELLMVHERVERRFRFKRAEKDSKGDIVVRSSSDSLLSRDTSQPNLFDRSAPPPERSEQWVIAYFLVPGIWVFHEVFAGRVTGKIGNASPCRLELNDVVRVPHLDVLPPPFKSVEDDLELPDHDEGSEEAAG